MLNRVAGALSILTLAAGGYLSLSVAILRPPRLNGQVWTPMAALFIGQSILTLIYLTGALSWGAIRWLLMVGSVAIVWAGSTWAVQSGRS